jgi:carboxypeptidase D
MTRARRGLLVLVAVALLASATARADALETVDVARPSDGGVVGSDAVPRTKQTIAADADADPTREEWRYRTNEELAAALRALHEGACAGISALSSAGRSVRGVDLPVLEIAVPEEKANSKTGAGGDNGGAKPSFGFIANMHGDEPVGRELALRLARLLCDAHRGVGGGGGDGDDAVTLTAAAALVASARLFFVPTMNPDGFATRSRNNANGVDLNRDFPDQFRGGLKLERRGDFGGGGGDDDAAGRQPETAAMMRWSRRVLSHTGSHTTPSAW